MLVCAFFKSCPGICRPFRNNSRCLETLLTTTATPGALLSESCSNFILYLQIHAATLISDWIEGHYFIWQLSFVTSCQGSSVTLPRPVHLTTHHVAHTVRITYTYQYSHHLFGDSTSRFLCTDHEQSVAANSPLFI